MEAINRSGTNEEFTEREQILQDCMDIMRDDRARGKEPSANERRKQRQEETAARQMLAMAMGNVASKKQRSVGVWNVQFVDVFFFSNMMLYRGIA